MDHVSGEANCKMRNRLLLILSIFAVVISIADSIAAQSSGLSMIKAGTAMRVKLETEINSGVNAVNDTFIARLNEPVMNGGNLVLPVGTMLEGRIVSARRAGFFSRKGRLEIVFEKIFPAGPKSREILARPRSNIRFESMGTEEKLIAITAPVSGTIIGGAASGTRGALIGGGLGSLAGIFVLFRGREAYIPTGQALEIVLDRDLILPVNDY
jgi:hypothetical protein